MARSCSLKPMLYSLYNKQPMQEFSFLTFMKNVGYVPMLLLGLSGQSVLILAVFMLIDTFLGATRVGIVHGSQHVKSYKATVGLISKLFVLTVPLLTVWAGEGVGIDLHILATGTINVLILAQFYSILSNIYSIHLRKDVEEFDAVSFILRRVQGIIEKMIKSGEPTVYKSSRLKETEHENND